MTSPQDNSKASAIRGVQMLYEEGQLENLPVLTIACHDRRWKIHRFIAVQSSEWIRLCCENGFKESHTATITFDNTMPETIDAMLRFLYYHEYKAEAIKVNDDTPESLSAFHAMVFTFADQYLFTNLKAYALEQFIIAADMEFNTPGFFTIVEMVYKDDSVCHDQGLRHAIADNIARHYIMLNERDKYSPAFDDILSRTPALGAHIISKMTGKFTAPKQYRCETPHCNGAMSLFIDNSIAEWCHISVVCPRCKMDSTDQVSGWHGREIKP